MYHAEVRGPGIDGVGAEPSPSVIESGWYVYPPSAVPKLQDYGLPPGGECGQVIRCEKLPLDVTSGTVAEKPQHLRAGRPGDPLTDPSKREESRGRH
jgi:hypothetical protein